MKKLILIIWLSITFLACTKEGSKIENQSRIKNDIPKELIGKWKVIAYMDWDTEWDTQNDENSWITHDTAEEYDWWFKEYSTCCIDLEENCDTNTYSASQGKLTFTPCGEGYSTGNDPVFGHYLFEIRKNILIIGWGHFDGWNYQKCIKVE